jgi:hypothetical protein
MRPFLVAVLLNAVLVLGAAEVGCTLHARWLCCLPSPRWLEHAETLRRVDCAGRHGLRLCCVPVRQAVRVPCVPVHGSYAGRLRPQRRADRHRQ